MLPALNFLELVTSEILCDGSLVNVDVQGVFFNWSALKND